MSSKPSSVTYDLASLCHVILDPLGLLPTSVKKADDKSWLPSFTDNTLLVQQPTMKFDMTSFGPSISIRWYWTKDAPVLIPTDNISTSQGQLFQQWGPQRQSVAVKANNFRSHHLLLPYHRSFLGPHDLCLSVCMSVFVYVSPSPLLTPLCVSMSICLSCSLSLLLTLDHLTLDTWSLALTCSHNDMMRRLYLPLPGLGHKPSEPWIKTALSLLLKCLVHSILLRWWKTHYMV